MQVIGISFSYAVNSLQTRGLSLMGLDSVFDMTDFNIPICNSNKSDGNVPDSVIEFDNILAKADVLVFGISEATAHYSAGFKNAMDWLVVKSKFNSRLGTDYTITKKPIFVITFTPTKKNKTNNGARHFEMTRHLLEKLGANVIDMQVVHDAWRTVVPGATEIVKEPCEQIKNFLKTYTPVPSPVLQNVDSSGWLDLYNEWNAKWQ